MAKSFVYVMRCGEYIKLGHALNPQRRLSAVDHANPVGVAIEHLVECDSAIASLVEAMAQDALVEFHCKGEWFKATTDAAAQAITAATEAAAIEIASGARKVRKIYLSALRKTQLRGIAGHTSPRGARTAVVGEIRQRAKAMWGDSRYTAGEVAKETGINLRTLYNQLGPRRNLNASLKSYSTPTKELAVTEAQARQMWFDRVRYPSQKEVADRCGVSTRTLYNRFGPREPPAPLKRRKRR